MHELIVIHAFKDKFTKKHYSKGDLFESGDLERIAFLQDKKFLEQKEVVSVIESAEEEQQHELKHVGGGYYELPNGEKVRGKENALEALKELE